MALSRQEVAARATIASVLNMLKSEAESIAKELNETRPPNV